MAITQFRDVVFNVLGDGASKGFSIDLAAAPASLQPEKVGSTICVTQPGFNFRVSPATVISVTVSDPANPGSTAAATLVKSLLTITFSAAPDNAMNPVEVFVRLGF